MLQRPDKEIILYDEDHECRQVRMDQPHPVEVVPSRSADNAPRRARLRYKESRTCRSSQTADQRLRLQCRSPAFRFRSGQLTRHTRTEAAKEAQDRAGT
jgi:hypothetical protein